jgi:hypothetical protein
MATTTSQTGTETRPTRKRSTRRSTTRRTTAAARRNSRPATTTSTQPKTPVQQVQELAERAVLVPVGASLLVRDNLVSTAKGLATKYRTRTGLERELKRYERRGASARNRFERQVRRTRTRFERQLRQRRSLVERTVKQNRRRFEREVRSVRKDLSKQSSVVGTRVEKLVSDAQDLLTQRF